jgi:uncharacterized protein YaeQ
MALTATIHRFEVALSDVDRGVYETLDVRAARHPSESTRYLMTRVLAYCLSYEEGIAFSKGGISSTDEPPVSVRDRTGSLIAWIDVGAPSAERLHKAAKAARRVSLFTHTSLALLRKEAASQPIHRIEAIDVHHFEPSFLDELAAGVDRTTSLTVVRSDSHLYVTIGATTLEAPLPRLSLIEAG